MSQIGPTTKNSWRPFAGQGWSEYGPYNQFKNTDYITAGTSRWS